MSASETQNIVQVPQTKRSGYKTLASILHPSCVSTCTFISGKKENKKIMQTTIHIIFPVQKMSPGLNL
jgi:hypothetical protein